MKSASRFISGFLSGLLLGTLGLVTVALLLLLIQLIRDI